MEGSFLDASILDIIWFILKVILALGIIAGIFFFFMWIYSFFWVTSLEKRFDKIIKEDITNKTGIRLSDKEWKNFKKATLNEGRENSIKDATLGEDDL